MVKEPKVPYSYVVLPPKEIQPQPSRPNPKHCSPHVLAPVAATPSGELRRVEVDKGNLKWGFSKKGTLGAP